MQVRIIRPPYRGTMEQPLVPVGGGGAVARRGRAAHATGVPTFASRQGRVDAGRTSTMEIGATQLPSFNACPYLNADTFGAVDVRLGQVIAARVVHPIRRSSASRSSRRRKGIRNDPMVPSLHIRRFRNLRAYRNGRPNSNASEFDH